MNGDRQIIVNLQFKAIQSFIQPLKFYKSLLKTSSDLLIVLLPAKN